MNPGDMDGDDGDIMNPGGMNYGAMNPDDAMNPDGAMNHDGMNRDAVDVNHAGVMVLGIAGHVLRQGVGLLKWVGDAIGAPIDDDDNNNNREQAPHGNDAAHHHQDDAADQGEHEEDEEGQREEGGIEAQPEVVVVAAAAAAAAGEGARRRQPEEEELLVQLAPLVGGDIMGPGNAHRVHEMRPAEGVPRVALGTVGMVASVTVMKSRAFFSFVVVLGLAFMAGVGVGLLCGDGSATMLASGDRTTSSRSSR